VMSTTNNIESNVHNSNLILLTNLTSSPHHTHCLHSNSMSVKRLTKPIQQQEYLINNERNQNSHITVLSTACIKQQPPKKCSPILDSLRKRNSSFESLASKKRRLSNDDEIVYLTDEDEQESGNKQNLCSNHARLALHRAYLTSSDDKPNITGLNKFQQHLNHPAKQCTHKHQIYDSKEQLNNDMLYDIYQQRLVKPVSSTQHLTPKQPVKKTHKKQDPIIID
ncbi:unnamed protein product, partial [Didymodactylos carnosus]